MVLMRLCEFGVLKLQNEGVVVGGVRASCKQRKLRRGIGTCYYSILFDLFTFAMGDVVT